MLPIALFLALAAPTTSSPERQMLDSLRAACDRAGDMAAMKADAEAAGWEPIAEDEDPRIARLNKLGREAVDQDAKIEGGNYRRTINGRRIFLILSRYEDRSGYWGAGCRLYDFEATKPLKPKSLRAWMGKPPTGVQTPAPGLSKRLWEPGWRDGISLEASHVPQGHELGQRFGLSGNILVAQAIGGF